MTYASLTIGDRNPVKRWLQARRYADALRHWNPAADRPVAVLDFGGGNGELLRRLAATPLIQATLYEPSPALLDEARRNLAGREGIALTGDLTELPNASFDCVFCLEVFEHLPEAETDRALSEIGRLLKPGGSAVIGVPVEIHLAALWKGLFRRMRRRGEYDARFSNIWAAARGRPPADRPVGIIAPGLSYHFHHLGFDYRRFERRLAERFRIDRRWFSPLPWLGRIANSEAYYLARRGHSAESDETLSDS